VGCMGGKLAELERDLRALTARALADERFTPEPTADTLGELAVTVSILDAGVAMGVQTPDEIAIRYRHGDQALAVFQGTRVGLLLPFVVVQHSLSPTQYVAEVIDKAGITRPPYHWAVYNA